MRCLSRRVTLGIWAAAWMACGAFGQKTLTWEEAKREFQASNPTLRAAQIGVQESRADEITAFLRPNPDLTTVGGSVESLHRQPLSAVCKYSAIRLRKLPA